MKNMERPNGSFVLDIEWKGVVNEGIGFKNILVIN